MRVVRVLDRQTERRRYDDLPLGPGAAALGRAIRRRRQSRGLSQGALAQRAGVDRSHLALVEGGRVQLGWTRLGRIACALELSVSTLAREAEIDRISADVQSEALGAPASAVALGAAVRGLRRVKGASIEAIGLSVGLHPTSVQKIERAERRPTWGTLCDLATALGVSVSALAQAAEREAAQEQAR